MIAPRPHTNGRRQGPRAATVPESETAPQARPSRLRGRAESQAATVTGRRGPRKVVGEATRDREVRGVSATVAPRLDESLRQVVRGFRAFSLTTHPRELAQMLTYAVPRHGLSPAAAIIGAALTWGDRLALTDQWGAMSYRELGAATVRLASGFVSSGVRPGTRVAIMARDDRHLLEALGAASLCGAAIAMLNPRVGADDLAATLAAERIRVVVHTPENADRLVSFRGVRISTSAFAELAKRTDASRTPHHGRASRLVMLTGGTTAGPSAIHIRGGFRAALPLLALAGGSGIRHGIPTLVCAPLFHGYGLACALLCLVAGSPLVTSSACRPGLGAQLDEGQRSTGADPLTAQLDKGRTAPAWGPAMYDAIRHERVGVVIAVPAQLRSLARELDATPRDPDERVTAVISGADRLDPETVAVFLRRWGPVVTNYYGTTETGTVTMITGADLAARPASLGRPVAGSKLRIVDERGDELPRGERGRIQLASLLSSVGDGWFTTSDVGWVDAEGYLYYTGRTGPKARMGGEFVSPAAVQDVLASIDGVAWARVSTEADALVGQRIVAEIGVREPVDEAALRNEVRRRLGPAAVPARITVRTPDPS